MAPSRDDFGSVRPIRRLNRLTQALLALALAVVVNFLASRPEFRLRHDITSDRRHSLAPESAETVRAAGRRSPVGVGRNQGWVKAVLVTNDVSEPAQVVRGRLLKLLDSYVVESGRSGPAWFSVELAGGGRNAPLLSELAARHGIPDASIALILSCGSRAKYVSYRELVTKEGGFRGEEAVTSALIEVTEDKAAICYVTTGHGELGVEDAMPERGMSLLSRQLRNRNFEVRQLNLATVAEVPRDAAMVLIAGPTTPFSASENARLKNYLYERNGRVLAMLDPGREHGLEPTLADWAIFSPDAELQEPDPARRTTDGDIALIRLEEKEHPLTKVLKEQNLPLIASRIRPARFDEGSAPDSTLGVWQLVFSSDAAWGETDLVRRPVKFDPDRDQPGPVCLAAAAERATGIRKGVGGAGGRLVVIGTSQLAANQRLNRGGNRAFVTQCAAWLTDRDRAISLPTRSEGEYQLNATAADFWTLALRFSVIPLAILAVGLAVSVWRRRS
ncbi:MAG: Gldg family protein [Opitutales bacterium]|nr:Gldg family protein [Opitutales bacterium]